jgi:hypothetical protein
MVSFKAALLLSGAALMAQAQTIPADLVGTWSSKSNSTMTGSVHIPLSAKHRLATCDDG